jgi:hypothetical protein
MGLTLGQRKAVTRETARRYRSAFKREKAAILDEMCVLLGWHRDHARKALRTALASKPVAQQRKPRTPVYGEEVIAALPKVWAVLDAPAGKRLAPFLPAIVERAHRLRRAGHQHPDPLPAGADVGGHQGLSRSTWSATTAATPAASTPTP